MTGARYSLRSWDPSMILNQNHLSSMNSHKKKIEYIAQFLRKTYFFILSILPIVICLTTIAQIQFHINMRGTDIVKANAHKTQSMEKVASITSRYNILEISDIQVFIKFFSAASALSLNQCVMKNVVDPITAQNASIGLTV